ncbi:carbohydrate ABC transporter permease [Paenibacillus sp. IB182496]|uniref:Carbohydrate ABC transporter permease n=1 Tax=Paenibacillus sabuli TaxID=2772509 RepID=A0A927BNX7_9BACL|nr:carbohydrate ABC transporter permease [Paenibacillus sabuli]MBD2844032.1 carbohydrate ABC transporter permease [Paenibacillus sabuli]
MQLQTTGNRIFQYSNAVLFVIISIVMLYPFWYVVMFSLSDPSNVSVNNLYLLPNGFTLASYQNVLKSPLIFSGFANTLIITIVGTFINLGLTALTAYPISRNRLVGRVYLFAFIMFTMIFQGGIIPTYLIVRSLGLLDTLWALMLPLAINVYNLLIMMKFFKNIPDSLIEAAYIDGCSDWGVFFRIVCRISGPVFAVIGLFYAVQHWNDFFQGMLYLNNQQLWPLQVGLRNLLIGGQMAEQMGAMETNVSSESFKMASVVVTVLPILLLYPFLQKFFVKGIMLGSVKG